MSKSTDAKILEAIERIDVMNMTPEEWELYDSKRKAILNYNTGMRNAEMRGENKGIKKAKIETAKKMKSKKIPIDIISEITGLSIEKIKSLKQNYNFNQSDIGRCRSGYFHIPYIIPIFLANFFPFLAIF